MKPIHISGTGSAIADYLYDRVDFTGPAFRRYMSKTPGDGGLEPGKLVLTDDFESFAGVGVAEAIAEIAGGKPPASFNLGGPAIAALINAAQMLHGHEAEVRFYATNGNDEAGARLAAILERTPVDTAGFRTVDDSSPYTIVLSDPAHGDGAGERTFINNIGSSALMRSDYLDDRFYEADIRLFGGTALVPPIHEALTTLLERARDPSKLSVVSTVYDFPNQKKHPERHWPLGTGDSSYPLIDLLIVDSEEAFRLSGHESIEAAIAEFDRRGLESIVITRGTDDVVVRSHGGRFAPIETTVPISRTNSSDRGDDPWDTTGCGDNFVGGILYSLAVELAEGRKQLDLASACRWGVSAGDFACYYVGGTWIESKAGEKYERIAAIHRRYEERYRG